MTCEVIQQFSKLNLYVSCTTGLNILFNIYIYLSEDTTDVSNDHLISCGGCGSEEISKCYPETKQTHVTS